MSKGDNRKSNKEAKKPKKEKAKVAVHTETAGEKRAGQANINVGGKRVK